MKSTRFVLMLLIALALAAAAEAQCLKCQRRVGMPPNKGECVESTDNLCSGVCCGGSYGMECSIPDALWPCSWLASEKFDAKKPAFTSRLLLERNTTLMQRRLSRCSNRV